MPLLTGAFFVHLQQQTRLGLWNTWWVLVLLETCGLPGELHHLGAGLHFVLPQLCLGLTCTEIIDLLFGTRLAVGAAEHTAVFALWLGTGA